MIEQILEKEIHLVTCCDDKRLNCQIASRIQNLFQTSKRKVSLEIYFSDLNITKYQNNKNYKTGPEIQFRDLDMVMSLKDFVKRMKKLENKPRGRSRGFFGSLHYNYAYDVIRFSKKAFALTDSAFNKIKQAEEGQRGWLIWLDINANIQKLETASFILSALDKDLDIVFFEQENFDNKPFPQSSIMAFNLDKREVVFLLEDYHWTYESGEAIRYMEWHNRFILDSIISWHKYHHELKVKSHLIEVNKAGQFGRLSNKLIKIYQLKRQKLYQKSGRWIENIEA